MLHFLKYLFLTVILFVILNLFRSNMNLEASLSFEIPYIGAWASLPLSINYLLLISFCAGILFAAFLGAFKFGNLRAKNREIKALRKTLGTASSLDQPGTSSRTDSLPPLAE